MTLAGVRFIQSVKLQGQNAQCIFTKMMLSHETLSENSQLELLTFSVPSVAQLWKLYSIVQPLESNLTQKSHPCHKLLQTFLTSNILWYCGNQCFVTKY